MYNKIRKISIGPDYKNGAMHYSLGQEVWGKHIINDICHDESDDSYIIYIERDCEVMQWKRFNANMAISIEYDLEY